MNNGAEFLITCPHCLDIIMIEKINCGIFRHGVFKNTLEQIPPHSTKEFCDRLFEEDEIYGCGKPFEIKYVDGNFETKICDYI